MGDATDTFGWASLQDGQLVAPSLEYMRKNRFILEFSGLPAGLTTVLPDAKTTLRLNVASASRPDLDFEETIVHRINGQVKMAGKPKYGDVSVKFYDSLKQASSVVGSEELTSCSDVLEAWRELMYQPNMGDAFGAVANYKALAFLHMLQPQDLAPTGSDGSVSFDILPTGKSIVQTWMLQGLFPKSIKYGEVAYESSDVQQVEVVFSVDRYYRVKPKTG